MPTKAAKATKTTKKAATRRSSTRAADTPTTPNDEAVAVTGNFTFPKDMTLLDEDGKEREYKAGETVPEHIERQMKGLPATEPQPTPDLGPVPGPGQAFAYEVLAERK